MVAGAWPTALADTDLPGVNFYSPIGVASGLGSAGRGYLAALRAAGIKIAPVPVHELFIHQPGIGNSERRRRPRHPIALVHLNADTIHRFLHFHSRSFDRARATTLRYGYGNCRHFVMNGGANFAISTKSGYRRPFAGVPSRR